MLCIVLWIPAYAGMTVGDAGNDGPGVGVGTQRDVSLPPCGYCLEASMTGRGIWLVLVCCLPCPVAVCQNQDLQDYRGFTGL